MTQTGLHHERKSLTRRFAKLITSYSGANPDGPPNGHFKIPRSHGPFCQSDFAYAIACRSTDGVHSGLRGEDDKLCALVIVGVTARGKKRFLAIEDGVRESTQSWREVLLSLKGRGMNAPKLAIGPSHRLQANDCRAVDGAMGFWAALDEVYPETRQQRCWQHKTMNVLNCLPKLSQPKAKAAIHNISFSGM